MRSHDAEFPVLTKRRSTLHLDMPSSGMGGQPSPKSNGVLSPTALDSGPASLETMESLLQYKKNIVRRLKPRRTGLVLTSLLTLMAVSAAIALLFNIPLPIKFFFDPLRQLLMPADMASGNGSDDTDNGYDVSGADGGKDKWRSLDGHPSAASEAFIYVYDFGTEFTADVLTRNTSWWSPQYEAERTFHELLTAGRGTAYRTLDPTRAKLFFVPFYSAYYLNSIHVDAEVNMKKAVEETSKMWGRVLRRVKEYPYFARSNGQDHFSFLTMDHGRCTALTFLDPAQYGDMFFLQLNGDRLVRSNCVNPERGMQALTYNYRARVEVDIPDIACYMASAGGKDIVIPPIVRDMPLVSPLAGRRNVSLLFRFGPGQHHGVPISHHGHFIRRELYDMYANKSIEGWDFAVKSEEESNHEWGTAVFCASPPGHSQWTSRPSKAILSGCIPVTFFRDHDNPWHGLIDWSEFSINVDPDQLGTMEERIQAVLNDPPRLLHMQMALRKVQSYFLWLDDLERGAEQVLVRLLWQRAQSIRLPPSASRPRQEAPHRSRKALSR